MNRNQGNSGPGTASSAGSGSAAGQNVSERQFFSQQNTSALLQTISSEFQKQNGSQLQDTEQKRLVRTLDHYMNEIWDTNGPMPLQVLNNETLSATASDFVSYLRRSNIQMVVPPHQQPLRTVPSALTTSPPSIQRPEYENNIDQRLSIDTGNRYEQIQQERYGSGQAPKPSMPDFRIALDNDTVPAVNLYEQIKKQREEEASRTASSIVNNTQVPDFSRNGDMSRDNSRNNELVDRMVRPAITDDPNANSTLALPTITPLVNPTVKSSAQDVLIKQDSILSYKEVENNLFVYSGDRDWLNNTRDNRYNFSVGFQSGNIGQSFGYGPISQEKFKNIVRIELVKAIIPTEGLDTFVVNTAAASAAPTYNSSTRLNVLGYPYIITRIPELDGNNYGTDNAIDNAFGILQYDANWISDSVSTYVDSRGYLAMIPKFMKCQKSYSPTPLATLTKMTIQLNRPDGNILSVIPDTVSISQILSSTGTLPGAGTPSSSSSYIYPNVVQDSVGNSTYYIFVTKSYFSRFTLSAGDRIQLKGLDSSMYPAANLAVASDMIQYFQNTSGFPVISIGCVTSLSANGVWTDGPNSVGYANFFVLRAPFADPTTGSVNVLPFGGSSGVNQGFESVLTSTALPTGSNIGAINMSHQTQLVFRIITREMDSTSRIRPDNL